MDTRQSMGNDKSNSKRICWPFAWIRGLSFAFLIFIAVILLVVVWKSGLLDGRGFGCCENDWQYVMKRNRPDQWRYASSCQEPWKIAEMRISSFLRTYSPMDADGDAMPIEYEISRQDEPVVTVKLWEKNEARAEIAMRQLKGRFRDYLRERDETLESKATMGCALRLRDTTDEAVRHRIEEERLNIVRQIEAQNARYGWTYVDLNGGGIWYSEPGAGATVESLEESFPRKQPDEF